MDNIIPIGLRRDIQIAIIRDQVHNPNHAIEQMFGSVGKEWGASPPPRSDAPHSIAPIRKEIGT